MSVPMSTSFNLPAFSAYLRNQGISVNNAAPNDISEALIIKPLSGGQSNPTFYIEAGKQKMVLRKKPAGHLLPSAHAIDREYRVMAALAKQGVPVPQMLSYCEDESIVGTPFFLMSFLDGRVLTEQALPGMSTTERAAIYSEMNRVIASIHAVDYQAADLESFGKPGNYFARQIARWSRQCNESNLPISPALQRLIAWLPEHIPPGDETTLVHGDFRMDNLIFHPTKPEVIGVIDWELSTLGHPLADFAYQCMAWHIPPTLWRGIGGLDLTALGIPTEAQYVAQYAANTGRNSAEHWDFYLAYNFFRIAAILHGIAQRVVDGNASGEDAIANAQRSEPLAELGWQCALRYSASR
jgi:acyl-CoA dehydrogenase